VILGKVGEFILIDRLVRAGDEQGSGVMRGVGDDAAVLKLGDDRCLLVTCDIQIEGIHFTWDSFSPEQVGNKAAAVNLSDIAAMGGKPTFAVVSLAAPAAIEVDVLVGVYSGLRAALKKWGAEIVGGNTAELPERTTIDVTLLGEAAAENLLLRNGARLGDIVCVTGLLGASAAGLELLKNPSLVVDDSIRSKALDAHRAPVPRLVEGEYLGQTHRVTSCIDLSDGLLGDAAHIAEQSGVTILIDLDRVPISDEAEAVAEALGIEPEELAAARGEDYELLFTASPAEVDDVLRGLEKETGTKASVIGEVRSGRPEVLVEKNKKPWNITKSGFDHFG
jgi:thiamine-monophosphate kinase